MDGFENTYEKYILNGVTLMDQTSSTKKHILQGLG